MDVDPQQAPGRGVPARPLSEPRRARRATSAVPRSGTFTCRLSEGGANDCPWHSTGTAPLELGTLHGPARAGHRRRLGHRRGGGARAARRGRRRHARGPVRRARRGGRRGARRAGPSALALDVRDEDAGRARRRAASTCSSNVAGIGSTTNAPDTPLEVWEDVFAVNARGTFLCCKHAIPGMVERGGGAIVNIASVAGLVGLRNRAAYCASKGAVIALTRALAIDHVGDGIRVNAVCPGTVDSPWVRRLVEEAGESLDALRARQPMGRLGTPTRSPRRVLYLASDDAAFVTGTALRDRRRADGGLTCRRSSPRPATPHSTAVAEVPSRGPARGEVLLRTLEVGVCGTDREISEGLFGVAPRGRGPARARPRAARRRRARRPRLLARGPRRRHRAPVVRALRGVRGGLAGRLRHGRLLRARDHPAATASPASWWPRRPEHLVAVPASLGRLGVLAEPASICARGDPPRARGRGAPAVARRARAGARHRRDRHAGDATSCASTASRSGPRAGRAATDPKARLVEACGARYVSTRETPLARARAARSAASTSSSRRPATPR